MNERHLVGIRYLENAAKVGLDATPLVMEANRIMLDIFNRLRALDMLSQVIPEELAQRIVAYTDQAQVLFRDVEWLGTLDPTEIAEVIPDDFTG